MKNDTETPLETLVSSAMDTLSQMIAAAPPDESSCEIDGNAPDHHAKISDSGLVRASNGWGCRYIANTELKGEQWQAAYETAANVTKTGGIVALVGNRGTGKTQIAAEITRNGMFPTIDASTYASGCKINRTSQKSLYRRAIDIFLDLRDAAKNHTKRSEKEVLAGLHDCGLLVIDEYQERGETEWENRIMRNLIDKRYADKRATIIIANLTRKELFAGLGESVIDRARENGKSIECNWASYRDPEKSHNAEEKACGGNQGV